MAPLSIGSWSPLVAAWDLPWPVNASVSLLLVILVALLLMEFLGLRYIPNNRVGIVEKLWSPSGSVPEGRIIALDGEAGYQAELLRGGIHFGLWRWQYRIHKVPLVDDSAGQDRLRLRPRRRAAAAEPDAGPRRRRATISRTPGRSSGDREGQDPLAAGQRGRQRAILREGVYAINLGAVRRDHRGRRLSLAASPDQQELEAVGRLAARTVGRRRLQPGGHRRPAA